MMVLIWSDYKLHLRAMNLYISLLNGLCRQKEKMKRSKLGNYNGSKRVVERSDHDMYRKC
jgi:hypothetical protein